LLDTPSYPAVWRTKDLEDLELFGAYGVFREGAENCARGGRAPISTSVFGFNIQPRMKAAVSKIASIPLIGLRSEATARQAAGER
jgi:hypothetical protein